ncbi:hypothetical protein J2I47_02045 [Fibrella sp. HMF5335]|uniref:Uncharacterized protein n=1 Tax=Fibrella rubiginis TaxID=2817060 RepID=A0A939K3N5_9BACT|nr:hypothetical protein [Fibrella rubiginis]MBO0935321.1 hypothetical protein [Fibrella rubiginis]
MSTTNQYTFLSWARKGLVNNISPAAAGGVRAAVELSVVVNGQTVSQKAEVLGPQDVIGISPDMVIRTEPRHWITDFEPNFLSFVEFYEEDFPWRYTPQLPDGTKLPPWLTLIALHPDEFEADDRTHPLPSIKILTDAAKLFPPADQLWAWAHVHVNGAINNAADLDAVVGQNPDRAYSRLFCARKLKPEQPYHMFVVPTYELGRLAGLGLPVTDASLFGRIAAEGKGAGTAFPYYYSWYFHTGKTGDFEYLLTLLEPYTADKDIGRREMDVSNPDFGTEWTEPDKTLGLEGALKSPKMVSDKWPLSPTPLPDFQTGLQRLINLPEKLVTLGDPTPVVTVPFYGAKHILEKEIAITNNPAQDFWLTELNRDPRNRTAAGFGTKVIQTHQESYMRTAWEQVKQVNDINQRIRLVQMAMQAGQRLFVKHFAALNPAKALVITQLMHTKVTNSPTTIRHAISQSQLPLAAVSATFRRITRPGGTLIRRFGGAVQTADLVEGLNNGTLTTAPPQPKLGDTNTVGEVVTQPPNTDWMPDGLRRFLARLNEWLVLLIGLLIGVMLLAVGLLVLSLVVAALAVLGFVLIRYAKQKQQVQDVLNAENLTPDLVDKLPARPGFKVFDADAPEQPVINTNIITGLFADFGPDSNDAARFKTAMRDLFVFTGSVPPRPPVRRPLDLAQVQSRLFAVIEPRAAIARRFAGTVFMPDWLTLPPAQLHDVIVPVMAYPDFKNPMYRPLRDLGNDNICPGIGRIPTNKITLLLTNSPFVESYMVGLNHEMGRELLWREYPTDQRGSYFRTFWEKSGFAVPPPGQTAEQQAEAEKDIPRLHTWGKRTQLGAHPNPAPASGVKPPEKVVLTVRSDLFKRYPNTVVFAQRAKWLGQPGGEREMDETLEVTPGMDYNTDIIKTPRFGAEFIPDVKCFGFDLTLEQARGDATDPGWYFVIMERPGEPRFGMDEPDPAFNYATPTPIKLWNDLTWGHLTPTKVAYDQLDVLKLNEFRTPTLNGPVPSDPDDKAQRNEDNGHSWQTEAASMAYILYQAPVKVAVHATEMLDGVNE